MDLYIDFPQKDDVITWKHEEEYREVETYGEVSQFGTYISQDSS